MVYGRYMEHYRTTIPMVFLNQHSHHWGAQPCMISTRDTHPTRWCSVVCPA